MDDRELTRNQQRAIEMLIQADLDGLPITRLLKTAYSCPWCGQIIGRSGQPKAERKQQLAQHQAECERQGQKWPFVINAKTYYTKWMKDDLFTAALAEARKQVFDEAVNQAVRIMQAATVGAATELARQVGDDTVKDGDRRLAAIGILDRANLMTATKANVDLPRVDLVEIVRPESDE